MSNYNGYGYAQGPEVNVRMKVDIYTEGPNEGVIFDQVVYTGAPEGFDAQAWSNNLPKAAISHAPQAAAMIEYPQDSGASSTTKGSDRHSKSGKSRRHAERSGHDKGSQSSLASAATKTPRGTDAESEADSRRRRHKGSRRRSQEQVRREGTGSAPLTSSEEYQNTSREVEEMPPPPAPPPPRPETLAYNAAQQSCPLDTEPTPEIPESYSRQPTPAQYLVETPGECSIDPDVRINTFEEPTFTPRDLGALLKGAMPTTLDDVNESIGRLVRMIDERITTTTVTYDDGPADEGRRRTDGQAQEMEKQRTPASPAASSGSRKFVSFDREPEAPNKPRVNPYSVETLIDDVAEEEPVYAEPTNRPRTPQPRPRAPTPEREYHKDPYTPTPYPGGGAGPKPVPAPRRASLDDSTASDVSRGERRARLGLSKGASIDIAPLAATRPETLDFPPEIAPPPPPKAVKSPAIPRVNPHSYETLIDDVPEQEPPPRPPLPPRSPQPQSSSMQFVHNQVYAGSRHDESFSSSGSHSRAAYHPPLGDWTREDEDDRKRSRGSTESSMSGIPLVDRVQLAGLNHSGSSDSTLSNVPIPPPPRWEDDLSASRDSEHGARQNAASSRIFEMYTRKERGSGSGASDASSPSPLPPPLPPHSRADLPAPPPPPAVISAPMARLDDSIDDGSLGGHRHSIYTISEAGTLEEEEEIRTTVTTTTEYHHSLNFHTPDARQAARPELRSSLRAAIAGGWTGSARSRSSIDSERSGMSAVKGGGSYNLGEGASMLGDGDNLSDYLQGRLSPVGKDWEGENSVRSDDSVISEASLRADRQMPLYGSLEREAPRSSKSPERSFAELMHTSSSGNVPKISSADADSLRWKKMVLDYHRISSEYLHQLGSPQEQLRREFFGTERAANAERFNTAGSTTSVSSFASVGQDSVREAPVLTRPQMESGGMYGEARIGMAQVGSQHPMTQRQSPSKPWESKKSVRPTAL